MTRLYIIRHAEAEGNLYRRAHGWYDSRITENGMRQIAALEGRFADLQVDAAYSSDLTRTQTTAQAIVRPKHLELRLTPELREVGMGVWEDRTFGDLMFHEGASMAAFSRCAPSWSVPGGETLAQVADRMKKVIFRIAAENEGKMVAVFTHGSAIRCLQAALRGKHPSEVPELSHCENTGVTCLEFEGDQAHIIFENDASHLPAEIATLARQNWHKKGMHTANEVWFRPIDMGAEGHLYYEARKDAWESIHGSLKSFDGPGFVGEAMDRWRMDPRAVELVMLEDTPIGVLELAMDRDAEEGVGYVPFVYLQAGHRFKGMGVQLIGQAVSVYRQLGRKALRLRCAPDNDVAQRFYKRYGFHKIGLAPGARVPLELLEKKID